MKRLTHAELEHEIQEMRSLHDPASWDAWHAAKGFRAARLEFPLGELTNENISGFVWAWHAQDRIRIKDIQPTDSFNAQGLEGKVAVETTYAAALLAARELPPYRRAVYV